MSLGDGLQDTVSGPRLDQQWERNWIYTFRRPNKFSNVFVCIHTGSEAGPAEPKIQSTGFWRGCSGKPAGSGFFNSTKMYSNSAAPPLQGPRLFHYLSPASFSWLRYFWVIAPPLCPRGNYGTEERKVWSNGQSWDNRKGKQSRMFAKGAKPRKELSDGTEQKSVQLYKRGNIWGIPHPRTLPTMYPSHVLRVSGRIRDWFPLAPPGAPSQRSNGCLTLSSHGRRTVSI